MRLAATNAPPGPLLISARDGISIVETHVSITIDVANTVRRLDPFRPPFDSNAFATLLGAAHRDIVAAVKSPVSRGDWWRALWAKGLPVDVSFDRMSLVKNTLACNVFESLTDTYCQQNGADQTYSMQRRDGVDASVVAAFAGFQERCIADAPEIGYLLDGLHSIVRDIVCGRPIPCALQPDPSAPLGRQLIPWLDGGG